MAATGVAEQTYLDVLLAQLLVLLKRERASFTSLVIATVAGALGVMHEAGLSAKRAARGEFSCKSPLP